MSVARVYEKKGRKPWTCDRCRKDIPVGVLHRSWSVGFRGRTVRRCMECPAPLTSELESSAVSSVYSAIEGCDFASAGSRVDLDQMIEDVRGACEEVADEYESNPMFENSEDLQTRAETLRSSAGELDSWADSLPDEPHGGNEDEPDAEWTEWFTEARGAAQSAVNEMEMP